MNNLADNEDSSKNIKSSEIVEDQQKRQYHIGLAPGEVANTVILVGDPQRAEKVAEYFDSIEVQKSNREFVTFTGKYKNLPITVMSTGIGPSNVEIAIIELSRIFNESDSVPTFIRAGSSGSLQEKIQIGELVISTGAVRLEDTSTYFVDTNYPALANYEVILALISSAEKNKMPYHIGITASASGFYGAQGRELEKFPVRENNIQETLAKRNVLNFEMESSALFTLSSLANFRSGTVCAVYANRQANTFIDEKTKQEAEQRVIQCGLDAALIISKMDEVKKISRQKNWTVDLSLK